MKSFTDEQLQTPVPMTLSWRMGQVMESKGRQELYEAQKPKTLASLREIAMIQSAESSNRIEGVVVERERLKPLVMGTTKPRDRSEEEIVGYREALSWIHENHAQIPFNADTLRALHEKAQGGFSGDAGVFKQRDNDIIELMPNGDRRIRFRTVTAEETPRYVEQLCLAYQHLQNQDIMPPLLLIASTVFDFLCIHPFRDGNGRVSRLLTLLLLYHHGYRVGRYVSVEKIIEDTKESYYDALYQSSQEWHQGEHVLFPWWMYCMTTIYRAYQQFEERVQEFGTAKGAKTEAVELAIETVPQEFTIRDIEARCPHVSREQIRKVLRQQRDEGRLQSIGRGRGSRWQKVPPDQ